jgi:hypothetical protein
MQTSAVRTSHELPRFLRRCDAIRVSTHRSETAFEQDAENRMAHHVSRGQF